MNLFYLHFPNKTDIIALDSNNYPIFGYNGSNPL